MLRLRKALDRVLDFFEIYLPSLAFVGLFVTYVIMIVYRYMFKAQLNWVYELSMIAFVWSVILAASYSSRIDEHIMFTMLYDKLPDWGKTTFRIIGNLAIIVAFSFLLPHAWSAVDFLEIKKSSLLKIPFNIIYAPFIVYALLTILHHFRALLMDITHMVSYSKGARKE